MLLRLLLGLALLPGCALNPFTAKIISEPLLVHTKSSATSQNETKAFVLLHGIYGDEGTFGNLPLLLQNHYPGSSVYVMSYWSSRVFPNFQRLQDLGSEFKIHLEQIASKHEEIIIIAHSQGGLIAKYAILRLLETGGGRELLNSMKLVMVGTPNLGSPYATYNNIFVNSLFAPVTYAYALVTQLPPFIFFVDNAIIYNRQAFDMSELLVTLKEFGLQKEVHAPFIHKMILDWGNHFPVITDSTRPKLYAIVGVKDIFNQLGLSDGVVHSTNALFAGVSSNRIWYVPYKHFGEEMHINEETHRSFLAIQEIIADSSPVNQQAISPLPRVSVSFVVFVANDVEDVYPWPPAEFTAVAVEMESIERKGLFKTFRLREDLIASSIRLVTNFVLLPFDILQTTVIGAVVGEGVLADIKATMRGTFEKDEYRQLDRRLLSYPLQIAEGSYKVTLKLSKRIRRFHGIWRSEVDTGTVEFILTDDPEDTDGKCIIKPAIKWESLNQTIWKSQEVGGALTGGPGTGSIHPPKLKIVRNAVNYIRADAWQSKQNELSVVVVGCEER